jgi:CheY-like chemotaxis protein
MPGAVEVRAHAHCVLTSDGPQLVVQDRPHVLIVEDDPGIRDALADLLHAEGYETDLATNGAEAIDFLETTRRPSAVLVDLLMPGIVGQELLEYLRGDAALASIPVAIFSASPQLAPPGYAVFRKPLDLPPLLAFLRQGIAASA